MATLEDILNAQRRAAFMQADVQAGIKNQNEIMKEKQSTLARPDGDKLRKEYARKLNAKPRPRADLDRLFQITLDPEQLRENYEVISFFAPFVYVRNKFSNAEDILVFQHSPRFYWQFEQDPEAVELLTGIQFPVSEDFSFEGWLEK